MRLSKTGKRILLTKNLSESTWAIGLGHGKETYPRYFVLMLVEEQRVSGMSLGWKWFLPYALNHEASLINASKMRKWK